MTLFSARTVVIAVAMIGLGATASGQTEEVLRTIPIGTAGTFTLSNLSGRISVTGTDGTDVVLRATKRLPDDRGVDDPDAALGRVEIEIRERSNRVEVETEYDGSSGRGVSVSVDYEVTVPRDTQVIIESISGDVTVDGVEAETRIEAVSGTVRLTALPELVEVEAVSGDIWLTDVGNDEDLSIESVSGRITVDGITAPDVDIASVSGPISLNRMEATRVDLEVVSGSVAFEGPLAADGQYDFASHSGNITLAVPAGSGFELEAESFSGDLRSAFPIIVGQGAGAREITTFDPDVRSVEGLAGAGGAQIEISTFSGDIAIEVQ